MKISIITAVYNSKNTIGCAINSIQSQKFQDVEHIIQDGCSTDGSLAIINGILNKSSRVYSEKDSGIYDAINRGICRSSGDVVGIMHSDDFFAHDRVLGMIADALSNDRIDGVYGDLQYVGSDDTGRVVRHWKSGDYSLSKLRRGWMPPHPTLYVRRDIFERWGLYDTSFRIAADYDAMLRYLVKGQIKLAYIPEVLVKMRVGGESNRSLERILLKSREDLRALRRNGVGGFGTLAMKNISKIGQFVWGKGQAV